ncbi:MAG: hypothetical protein M3R04_10310, partial [bacterium]|nr:hypothetical protein [bacterium]
SQLAGTMPECERDRLGFAQPSAGPRPHERDWSITQAGTPVPPAVTTAELLADIGVTPRMLKAATPLTLEPDPDDIEAMQRELRRWILGNIDTWVGGRDCSLWSAFSALKDTFALDYRVQALALRQTVADASLRPYGGRDAAATSAKKPPMYTLPTARADAPMAVVYEQAVQVPVYDPQFDVVANLPLKMRQRKGPDGSALGFGNSPDEARRDYLAKAERDMGPGWQKYTMAPAVSQDYDELNRGYYTARPGSATVEREEAMISTHRNEPARVHETALDHAGRDHRVVDRAQQGEGSREVGSARNWQLMAEVLGDPTLVGLTVDDQWKIGTSCPSRAMSGVASISARPKVAQRSWAHQKRGPGFLRGPTKLGGMVSCVTP